MTAEIFVNNATLDVHAPFLCLPTMTDNEANPFSNERKYHKLLLITALSPNWLYFLIYSICLNFMKIFSMTCTSLQPAPNLWNMEEQYCRIIKALSRDSGKNKWFLHKPDIRGQCTFSPHPFRCARNVIMTLNQNPS